MEDIARDIQNDVASDITHVLRTMLEHERNVLTSQQRKDVLESIADSIVFEVTDTANGKSVSATVTAEMSDWEYEIAQKWIDNARTMLVASL